MLLHLLRRWGSVVIASAEASARSTVPQLADLTPPFPVALLHQLLQAAPAAAPRLSPTSTAGRWSANLLLHLAAGETIATAAHTDGSASAPLVAMMAWAIADTAAPRHQRTAVDDGDWSGAICWSAAAPSSKAALVLWALLVAPPSLAVAWITTRRGRRSRGELSTPIRRPDGTASFLEWLLTALFIEKPPGRQPGEPKCESQSSPCLKDVMNQWAAALKDLLLRAETKEMGVCRWEKDVVAALWGRLEGTKMGPATGSDHIRLSRLLRLWGPVWSAAMGPSSSQTDLGDPSGYPVAANDFDAARLRAAECVVVVCDVAVRVAAEHRRRGAEIVDQSQDEAVATSQGCGADATARYRFSLSAAHQNMAKNVLGVDHAPQFDNSTSQAVIPAKLPGSMRDPVLEDLTFAALAISAHERYVRSQRRERSPPMLPAAVVERLWHQSLVFAHFGVELFLHAARDLRPHDGLGYVAALLEKLVSVSVTTTRVDSPPEGGVGESHSQVRFWTTQSITGSFPSFFRDYEQLAPASPLLLSLVTPPGGASSPSWTHQAALSLQPPSLAEPGHPPVVSSCNIAMVWSALATTCGTTTTTTDAERATATKTSVRSLLGLLFRHCGNRTTPPTAGQCHTALVQASTLLLHHGQEVASHLRTFPCHNADVWCGMLLLSGTEEGTALADGGILPASCRAATAESASRAITHTLLVELRRLLPLPDDHRQSQGDAPPIVTKNLDALRHASAARRTTSVVDVMPPLATRMHSLLDSLARAESVPELREGGQGESLLGDLLPLLACLSHPNAAGATAGDDRPPFSAVLLFGAGPAIAFGSAFSPSGKGRAGSLMLLCTALARLSACVPGASLGASTIGNLLVGMPPPTHAARSGCRFAEVASAAVKRLTIGRLRDLHEQERDHGAGERRGSVGGATRKALDHAVASSPTITLEVGRLLSSRCDRRGTEDNPAVAGDGLGGDDVQRAVLWAALQDAPLVRRLLASLARLRERRKVPASGGEPPRERRLLFSRFRCTFLARKTGGVVRVGGGGASPYAASGIDDVPLSALTWHVELPRWLDAFVVDAVRDFAAAPPQQPPQSESSGLLSVTSATLLDVARKRLATLVLVRTPVHVIVDPHEAIGVTVEHVSHLSQDAIVRRHAQTVLGHDGGLAVLLSCPRGEADVVATNAIEAEMDSTASDDGSLMPPSWGAWRSLRDALRRLVGATRRARPTLKPSRRNPYYGGAVVCRWRLPAGTLLAKALSPVDDDLDGPSDTGDEGAVLLGALSHVSRIIRDVVLPAVGWLLDVQIAAAHICHPTVVDEQSCGRATTLLVDWTRIDEPLPRLLISHRGSVPPAAAPNETPQLVVGGDVATAAHFLLQRGYYAVDTPSRTGPPHASSATVVLVLPGPQTAGGNDTTATRTDEMRMIGAVDHRELSDRQGTPSRADETPQPESAEEQPEERGAADAASAGRPYRGSASSTFPPRGGGGGPSRRPVLHLHLGTSASRRGDALWQLYAQEHHLSYSTADGWPRWPPTPTTEVSVLYRESPHGHLVPRCLYVDDDDHGAQLRRRPHPAPCYLDLLRLRRLHGRLDPPRSNAALQRKTGGGRLKSSLPPSWAGGWLPHRQIATMAPPAETPPFSAAAARRQQHQSWAGAYWRQLVVDAVGGRLRTELEASDSGIDIVLDCSLDGTTGCGAMCALLTGMRPLHRQRPEGDGDTDAEEEDDEAAKRPRGLVNDEDDAVEAVGLLEDVGRRSHVAVTTQMPPRRLLRPTSSSSALRASCLVDSLVSANALYNASVGWDVASLCADAVVCTDLDSLFAASPTVGTTTEAGSLFGSGSAIDRANDLWAEVVSNWTASSRLSTGLADPPRRTTYESLWTPLGGYASPPRHHRDRCEGAVVCFPNAMIQGDSPTLSKEVPLFDARAYWLPTSTNHDRSAVLRRPQFFARSRSVTDDLVYHSFDADRLRDALSADRHEWLAWRRPSRQGTSHGITSS